MSRKVKIGSGACVLIPLLVLLGLFYKLALSAQTILAGASSGLYGLFGFFSGKECKEWFSLLFLPKVAFPLWVLATSVLSVECVMASKWVTVIAWERHVIAFIFGLAGFLFLKMIVVLIGFAANFQSGVRHLDRALNISEGTWRNIKVSAHVNE